MECKPCCCNLEHTEDILLQNYVNDYQHDRNVRGHDRRPLSTETSEALAALKEKACSSLRQELKAMTEACQPSTSKPVPNAVPMQHGGAEVRRQADLIDYVPESEFLRKMKQQCEYLRTNQENIFSALDELGLNDLGLNETYPLEYSKSGIAFSSGNQVNVRKSPSENLGQMEYNQRPMRVNERDLEYAKAGRQPADRFQMNKFQGSPARNVERKSEHVSRSKKKTFNNRGTRKRTTSEKSHSRDRFEPTLKRPHEDSCERCWRYASPARSPVNKPDQKYDPNFRKAHSQQDFEKGDGNLQYSAETVPSAYAQSISSRERVKLASQRSDSPQQRDNFGPRSQVVPPGQRAASRQRDEFSPRGQVGLPNQGIPSQQMDGYVPMGQIGSPSQRPISPRQKDRGRNQVVPSGQRPTSRQKDEFAPRGQVGPPQYQQSVQKASRPGTAYSDAQSIQRDMMTPPQISVTKQRYEVQGKAQRAPSSRQQHAQMAKPAGGRAKARDLNKELPPSKSAERNVFRRQPAEKSVPRSNQNLYADSGRPPRPKSCTPGIGHAETYQPNVARENIPQDFRNTARSAVGQVNYCVPHGRDFQKRYGRHDVPLTSFIDPGLFSGRERSPRPCDCCVFSRTAQPDICATPSPVCEYSSGGFSTGGRSPTGRYPGGHPAGGFSPDGRSPAGRSPGGRSPGYVSPGGRPPSAPGGLSSDALQQRATPQSQNRMGSGKQFPKTPATNVRRGAPQLDSIFDTTEYYDLPGSSKTSPTRPTRLTPQPDSSFETTQYMDIEGSSKTSPAKAKRGTPKPDSTFEATQYADVEGSSKTSPAKAKRGTPKPDSAFEATQYADVEGSSKTSPAKAKRGTPKPDSAFEATQYAGVEGSSKTSPAKAKRGTPKPDSAFEATQYADVEGSSKTSPTKAKRGTPKPDSMFEATQYNDFGNTINIETRKKDKSGTASPKQGSKGMREGVKTPKTSPTTSTQKSGGKSTGKSSKSSKSSNASKSSKSRPKSIRIWSRDEEIAKRGKSPKSKGLPSKFYSRSPLKYTSQKSQEPPNEKKCDFETNGGYQVPCPDMRDLFCNQTFPGARTIPNQSNVTPAPRDCCCPVQTGKSYSVSHGGPLDNILCCHCNQGHNQNQNNEIDSALTRRILDIKKPTLRPSGRPQYPSRFSPISYTPIVPDNNFNQNLQDFMNEPFIECPYTQNEQAAESQKKYEKRADQVNKRALRERQNLSQPPYNCDVNPKTYFVFYMTKSKQYNGKDDVEVLVEEVSQTCPGTKDARTKDITEKMKKIMEGPSDSLALRFQKGVTEYCKTPRSSRTLYF